MQNKDLVRIQHMLDSTQAILTFTKGKRQTHLDKDRLLYSAIIREFAIIGEAAAQVSQKIRDKYSKIPWRKIIGMRNRLVHVYYDIDRETIWKAIRKDLPDLQKKLKQILKTMLKEKAHG